MLVSVLVAGFVAFLYLPSQVFRFSGAAYADLHRRPTASQFDEFFAASVPSLFLNVSTLAVWWAGRRLGVSWMRAPFWPTIFSVLMSLANPEKDPPSGHAPVLSDALPEIGMYWVILLLVASVLGGQYGWFEHHLAKVGGVDEAKAQFPPWKNLGRELWSPTYPSTPGKAMRWLGWRVIIFLRIARKAWLALNLFFYKVWDHCYVRNKNTIYPWVMRNSTVFVMLKNGHVFHGILRDYRNTRDGETEGILLDEVRRFEPDKLLATALAGEDPFLDLTGRLYLKWEEVRDVNFAPKDQMADLEQFYRGMAQRVRDEKAARPMVRAVRAWRVLRGR